MASRLSNDNDCDRFMQTALNAARFYIVLLYNCLCLFLFFLFVFFIFVVLFCYSSPVYTEFGNKGIKTPTNLCLLACMRQ